MKVELTNIQANLRPVGDGRGGNSVPTEDSENVSTPPEDSVTIDEAAIQVKEEVDKSKDAGEKKSDIEINKMIMANRDYDYYINNNKEIAIKVIEKESGKVIKEIPTKAQQELREAFQAYSGRNLKNE